MTANAVETQDVGVKYAESLPYLDHYSKISPNWKKFGAEAQSRHGTFRGGLYIYIVKQTFRIPEYR